MIKIDEFLERAKKLEERYNRIIEKPEEKRTKFEAMVLHEVGNKVSGPIGFYDLFKEGTITEEALRDKYLPLLIRPLNISEHVIDLAEIKSFKKNSLLS